MTPYPPWPLLVPLTPLADLDRASREALADPIGLEAFEDAPAARFLQLLASVIAFVNAVDRLPERRRGLR